MLAAWRLWAEYPLLLWGSTYLSAHDLGCRYEELHAWFAGRPVYGPTVEGAYPPASYPMLWPVLGWLSFAHARWLWAATLLAMTAWLARITVRESEATTPPERACAALLPFAMYATAATVRLGQLPLHVLSLLVAGLLLLARARPGWRTDLLSTAMLLLALVKPQVSVPFMWIAFFITGRIRPAALIVGGYVALTILAAAFQHQPLVTLVQGFLTTAAVLNDWPSYGNVQAWLSATGLGALVPPVSLLALIAFGLWMFRHRRVDVWLLLGVTGIVARFWTYHLHYDDLLILIPMIALARVAHHDAQEPRIRVTAGGLLAATWAASLMPATVLALPRPWSSLMKGGLTALWAAVVLFLALLARREARLTTTTHAPRAGDQVTPAGVQPAV